MKPYLLIVLLILLSECQQANDTKPDILNPITFSEVYPGSILAVNKIELQDGTSGKLKAIQDTAIIDSFIDRVKDIILTPEEEQKGSVGFVYRVMLYEGDEMKMDFTPLQINGIYYLEESELLLEIQELFREASMSVRASE